MRLLARGATFAAAAWMIGGALADAGGRAGPLAEAEARADEPPRAVAPVAAVVSGSTCVLSGAHPVPKGTQLFDAASGGRAVASFSGTFAPLKLSDFPADPTTARTRASTTSGSASFRLDGWLAPGSVQVFSARDLPVSNGHVWISSAQKVRLVQAGPASLTAELTVLGTAGQTVRASAPCDAFSLQQGTPAATEVPGNGRGYQMHSSAIDFFDDPTGSVVFSLKMNEGSAQLFWSTESRAGFVHVKARADLTLDAWVRARDLEPLKKGEMMDQFIPSTTTVQGAQLSFDKPPRLVQAAKEIPLRAHRDDKEKPIGVVEAGAEVYVMETMAGWANLLPKALFVTPSDDGGFWVPAGEVP